MPAAMPWPNPTDVANRFLNFRSGQGFPCPGRSVLLGFRPMGEDTPGRPADKILCEGKFQRYVVACMRNCPQPEHCREFWAFFRARGESPQQYLHRHGIEEDFMKRIVFDCDRCGKRDIGEPWTLWHHSGESEGQRLPPEKIAATLAKTEPLACSHGFVEVVLEALKTEHAFEHYCEACFKKVASLAGAITGKPLPKVAPKPATASAASPVARVMGTSRPALVVKPVDDPFDGPATKGGRKPSADAPKKR